MNRPLCTTADVRALIGAEVADQIDTAALQVFCEGSQGSVGLIEQCSRRFEADVGVEFTASETVYHLDGKGTPQVMLPSEALPVIELQEVAFVGAHGSASVITGYTHDDAGVLYIGPGSVAGGRTAYPRWPRGRQNIRVRVRHGWEAVPVAVTAAVARMVAIEVLRAYGRRRDRGIQSLRIGDRSEGYEAGGRFASTIADWRQQIEMTTGAYRSNMGLPNTARRA